MITLIHGDNELAVAKRVSLLKDDFVGEKVTLNAKELTKTDFLENLTQDSLFGGSKLLIIDEINSNKKLFSDLNLPENIDLILVSYKKLTTSEISSLQKVFPKVKVEEYKLDPVVFKFVESLSPGNQIVMMPQWQKYIETEIPEIASAMIARQIRLLIASSCEQPGFEDFDKMPPWQKDRIKEQSSKFSLNSLMEFHSNLLKIDYQTKSGSTPLDYSSSLELLLLTL